MVSTEVANEDHDREKQGNVESESEFELKVEDEGVRSEERVVVKVGGS